LILVFNAPAFADGGSGFAFSGDLALAGGSQVANSSGTPSVAYGAEIGAHLDERGLFVGAYGDRYTSSIWQAGFTGKEFFGVGRMFWVQIKASVSGMAGMIGSNAQSKTWTNYLDGGIGAGLRIPVGAKVDLQPFAEFDSFYPILGTTTVSTGPGQSATKFVTGSRCNAPVVGARVAIEL